MSGGTSRRFEAVESHLLVCIVAEVADEEVPVAPIPVLAEGLAEARLQGALSGVVWGGGEHAGQQLALRSECVEVAGFDWSVAEALPPSGDERPPFLGFGVGAAVQLFAVGEGPFDVGRLEDAADDR